MLTEGGAKLLDFGLAKVQKAPDGETMTMALTGQAAIVGTIPYMSPEQLEGREADARSDIFAFGAVLYEMLTGRRAFQGQSTVSIYHGGDSRRAEACAGARKECATRTGAHRPAMLAKGTRRTICIGIGG